MKEISVQIGRAQAFAGAALALVLGTALAGCGRQENPTMLVTTLPRTAIPALDAAPAHVETATFALG